MYIICKVRNEELAEYVMTETMDVLIDKILEFVTRALEDGFEIDPDFDGTQVPFSIVIDEERETTAVAIDIATKAFNDCGFMVDFATGTVLSDDEFSGIEECAQSVFGRWPTKWGYLRYQNQETRNMVYFYTGQMPAEGETESADFLRPHANAASRIVKEETIH